MIASFIEAQWVGLFWVSTTRAWMVSPTKTGARSWNDTARATAHAAICYGSAMHCRSLALAISLIALEAALACESERPLADDLLRIDAGGQQPAGGGAGGEGSEDASVPEPAAPTDASLPEEPLPDASGPPSCEQADQTFRDFLAANQSCSVSSDCTMIGDCGPNADFAAINVAAAAMGYALMEVRCPGLFDGPTFAAVCQDGQCILGPENGCCGCPSDAGVDGG
jgi:hypothetical protein